MRAHRITVLLATLMLLAFLGVPASGQKEAVQQSGATELVPFTQPLPFEGVDPTLYDEAQAAPKAAERAPGLLEKIALAEPMPHSLGVGGGDVDEVEPNDIPDAANIAQDLPINCRGTIDHNWDRDWIRVNVTLGQHLEIDVFGHLGYFNTPTDPVLYVYNSDLILIGINDDIAPGNTNAQVMLTAPYTGTIYLRIETFGGWGTPNHHYIASVIPVNPTPTPIVEAEPNNDPSQADPFAMPGWKWGIISNPGDVDYVWFEGVGGATLVIDVHSQIYGMPLDAGVQLRNSSGEILFERDDADGLDPRFNIVLPYSGLYYVAVSDVRGQGAGDYVYLLTLSLQDGTMSPYITKLNFNTAGSLKKVKGIHFVAPGATVEVIGTPVASQPGPANPSGVLKVKPPVPVQAGHWVTVLNPSGRRSNAIVRH